MGTEVIYRSDPRLMALKALMTKVTIGDDGKSVRTPMLDDDSLKHVANMVVQHPAIIQMGSYTDCLGLNESQLKIISETQQKQIPSERLPYFKKLAKVIETTPTIPKDISLRSINPFTPFEKSPHILFGMGGGSQKLCQGLPFDVLSMVLTAEKIRRELNAGKINILCANDITRTNIGKHPSFSKESIDGVMSAERDLLQLVVEKFGLADHFIIFLSTDLDKIIGREAKNAYDAMVKDAEGTPFVHDQHYAMEIAEMYSLINQELGGIKLGWFMNEIYLSKPKYIMDEQPFDARYALYLASRGLTNTVSIPYVKAGVKLYPDKNGFVQKAAPYIDYEPANRILLSPFEKPTEKMIESSKYGGGTNIKLVRGHFLSIFQLFEQLVLNRQIYEVIGKPDYLEKGERGQGYGNRVQFILDFIFDGNRPYAEEVWKNAFPNSL